MPRGPNAEKCAASEHYAILWRFRQSGRTSAPRLPHTVARLARGDLVGLHAVLLGEEGAQVSQNIAQARVGSTDDVKMLKRIQGGEEEEHYTASLASAAHFGGPARYQYLNRSANVLRFVGRSRTKRRATSGGSSIGLRGMGRI
jgi:hypothetical protein